MTTLATKFPVDNDPIIRANRSIRPPASAYPQWEHQLLHPELELKGPREFTLEYWRHPPRISNGGYVDYDATYMTELFYNHLENSHILQHLLGLSDLLAIQARGMSFYRGRKWSPYDLSQLYGWRSAVRDAKGTLWLPRLIISEKEKVEAELKIWWYEPPIYEKFHGAYSFFKEPTPPPQPVTQTQTNSQQQSSGGGCLQWLAAIVIALVVLVLLGVVNLNPHHLWLLHHPWLLFK